MNQLYNYFLNNRGNSIDKWHHYFPIYELWFKKFKGKPVVVLEIGVFQGGSLSMWRDYFGEEAQIFAIDINPMCKRFESKNTKIFIGSQENEAFLKDVKAQMPPADIIIDDGGHTMNQQITSFKILFDHLKNGGVYLCEDLHTSYWSNYGGGFRKASSFIEYSKTLIDSLNAWHSREKDFEKDIFTKSIYSLHYYDSILVVEKILKNEPPISTRVGDIVIPIEEFKTKTESTLPRNKIFFLPERFRNLVRKMKGLVRKALVCELL